MPRRSRPHHAIRLFSNLLAGRGNAASSKGKRSGNRTASRRPARGQGRPSPYGNRLKGTARVLMAMALLGAINLYVLYYRHGTSVPALLRAAEVGRQASLLPGPPGTPPVARALRKIQSGGPGMARGYSRLAEVNFDSDDLTLEDALAAQGITGKQAESIAAAFQEAGAHPGAGQSLVLYFDAEEQFLAGDLRLNDSLAYRLEKTVTGSVERYTVSKQDRQLQVSTVAVSGTVQKDGGLFEAAQRAGEPEALGAMVAEVFGHDLDLPLDSHAGDRFRVVVEKLFLGKTFYRYGRVLAAEYEGKAGPLRAYLFPSSVSPSVSSGPPAKKDAYFNERGESLARNTLRSPLRLWRVAGLTAAERRRAVPVLHAERGKNLGVDYGAPLGTPVRAVAAGKIASHGTRGPAGNALVLAHGGMETLYQHLSRFAHGVADGLTVRKGQVIGYVGTSGLAPRPHLHFAVRVGGKMVDPLKMPRPHESAVPAADKVAFAARVHELDLRLDPQSAAVAQAR